MHYTLPIAKQRLHDVRRQLAQLEQREASQRTRLEQLEGGQSGARRAHSEAMKAKTRILAEFVAGLASQVEVDAARRLVDECATQMREAEELVTAVEADVRNITAQVERIHVDIGPAMTGAWRAVYEHLVANRPPEVDTYLSRLWAAARAAHGHADFGGILSAVHEQCDFTATEKNTRDRLAKEFLAA